MGEQSEVKEEQARIRGISLRHTAAKEMNGSQRLGYSAEAELQNVRSEHPDIKGMIEQSESTSFAMRSSGYRTSRHEEGDGSARHLSSASDWASVLGRLNKPSKATDIVHIDSKRRILVDGRLRQCLKRQSLNEVETRRS